MPLVSDRKSKPLPHSNSRSIGFWMSVEGRTPIQPVRVLVNYEALSQIDPTNVRDLHGALENFDRFRSHQAPAAAPAKNSLFRPGAASNSALVYSCRGAAKTSD